MSAKQAKRRWFRWGLILAGMTAVILLALPLWFPYVLRVAAGRFHLEYGRYERISYDRCRLHDLHYDQPGVTVRVEEVETHLFWGWLKDRWFRARPDRPHVEPWSLQARGWRVTLDESTKSGPSSGPAPQSVAEVLGLIEPLSAELRAWLVNARAVEGSVAWGEQTVQVKETTWREGRLSLQLEQADLPPARVMVDVSDQPPGWRAEVAFEEIGLSLRAGLNRQGEQWKVQGEVAWMGPPTNQLQFEAWLARGDWWPKSASLVAGNLQAPDSVLSRFDLDRLAGSLRVGWTNRQYTFAWQATAERPSESPLLPSRGEMIATGRGDLESVTVERLDLSAPPFTGQMEQPTRYSLADPLRVPEFGLALTYAIPSSAPFLVRGRLVSHLEVHPDPNRDRVPRIDFVVDGEALEALAVDLDVFRLEGQLDWPALRLETGQVALPDGSRLELAGSADLVERTLAGGALDFTGRVPPGWLPRSVVLGEVQAALKAEGPWVGFRHEGTVSIGAWAVDSWRGDGARLTWTGQDRTFSSWQGQLQARASTIQAAGSLSFDHSWQELKGRLTGLEFRRHQTNLLQLTAPLEFEVAQAAEAAWSRLRLDRLELGGPEVTPGGPALGLEAEIEWPRAGRVAGALRGMGLEALEDFLARPLPPLHVREFQVRGHWQDSPLELQAEWIADYPVPGAAPLVASGMVRLGPSQLEVPTLTVSQDTFTMAKVEGKLPLTVDLTSPDDLLRFHDDQAVALRMESVNAQPLWDLLEERVQLRPLGPNLSLSVTGQLNQARGYLDFQARQLVLTRTNLPMEIPPLEDLHLRVEADPGSLRLVQGQFRWLNQPGTIQGAYPVEAGDWAGWLEHWREPDWNRVSGRLRFQQARLDALAARWPEYVLPLGTLDLEAEVAPGLAWQGLLSVTNAATQPLPKIGSLRNLHGRARFDGAHVWLDHLQAEVSGQPVRVNGQAQWQPDALPWFDFQVQGTNLMLVRSSDLFLRGDLDLRLSHASNAPPRLAGEVVLRDSLLFRDFRSLVDIDLNRPETRPPYFSVSTPPLAEWGVDVRVKGDRFLRVSSPVFRGFVSCNLQVAGSLREPIALGDVTVPQGRLLFPFGTLVMNRGRVSLNRENPFHPQLDFEASGYNFGYMIRIDVSGSAPSPNLTFNSVPPLTPKEIILMLSAGEAPHRNVSSGTSGKVSQLGFYLGKELLGRFMDSDDTADRLILRSGEYVTDDGRLTYSIEYKFTERWSAIGEYNRFRDFNTGLKYKIYSK